MPQFRIGTRLGIGFGICVLFTLIVGVVGVRDNDALRNFTEDMHSHAYVMTNALRAANGNIIEIRETLKDMIAVGDRDRIAPFVAIIKDREQNIEKKFAIIREHYLGDPADIDRLMRDYETLSVTRQSMLALARDGEFDAARAVYDDKAGPIYATLRNDVEVIRAFVDRKAASFLGDAATLAATNRSFTWMVLAGAVVAAFAVAWLATRSITKPLAALESAMLALANGDLDVVIPSMGRKDQIGKMADAVRVFRDGLVHADELERALRQVQKIEAIGQLTGGIAHDFNNLLQVILSNLELSLDRLGSGTAIATYLHKALAGAEQGAKLTGQLLAFARRQPLRPEPLHLDRSVGEMTCLLRRTLGERIAIEMVADAGLWTAMADPNQLQNAVLNLAINARDAMPDGGKLTIELGNRTLDGSYAAAHGDIAPGQYVLLAVTDTGTGMSSDVLDRAFEPFFTTKPEGAGTGLGLSMVYGFVKQSGGHIKIYSKVGQGTAVNLYLPRSRQAEPERLIEESKPEHGNGETILVVEDDDGVRSTVVSQLAELGYRVLAAPSGEAALDILDRGERIDLLFTDVVMPGALNGRALADQARKMTPTLPILFTSGYTDNAIIHQGRLDEGVMLLTKPYRLLQLADAVRQAFSGRSQSPAAPADASSPAADIAGSAGSQNLAHPQLTT